MLLRGTRRLVPAIVTLLCLALAGPAAAADPWVADPSDIEGVYIITGSGPPNTRVDLVRKGSTWARPHYNDATINEGEYTSPSGQFRIDEGFCNPAADCDGGDEDPFQIVFYRGPSVAPLWGSGTLFRSEAEQLVLPEVENVARASRVFLNASGPASLPGYTTISGTTRIVRSGAAESTPLEGVLVDAFSSNGRGSDDLYASGGEYAARTYSLADGTWSMKVPPGSWALRYRTSFDEPFYPGYVWNSCVIEPSHIPPAPGTPPPAGTTYVNGSTTGVGLTVGEDGTCNGSAAGDPGDPPGGGGPGGGGGGPSGGGGGPAGGANPAAAMISPARASTAADGSVSLTVTVSGPGTVTAVATVAAPEGGAKKSAVKKVTVAKASIRAKKAGKVKLALKLNRAGKKLLGQKGRLTARAAIAFKPTGGPAATTSKAVTFKKRSKARPKQSG